jgi:hypothetical protein
VSPIASRFLFVADRYTGDAPAIGCDGLVPGAALDLTHWQGNRTPKEYKADTSTEIALKFVAAPESARWAGSVVLNNHFDTDGILSAWVLLDPERALEHRPLLIAAAEAGDFDEWPSEERGLWLDAAIRALADRQADDAHAYATVIPQLAELVPGIAESPAAAAWAWRARWTVGPARRGSWKPRYESARRDLWGQEWEALQAAWKDLENGRLQAEIVGRIGMLVHPPLAHEAPGAVLARSFLPRATRYLLAFDQGDGRFHYRYERPRYTWAETVVRPRIAAPDAEALKQSLGSDWTNDDLPGLTGIAQTVRPVGDAPAMLVRRLTSLDPSAA